MAFSCAKAVVVLDSEKGSLTGNTLAFISRIRSAGEVTGYFKQKRRLSLLFFNSFLDHEGPCFKSEENGQK